MITNKQHCDFIWKKAREQLNEEAFRGFLCYTYGVFSNGRVTTIQVNCLRKQLNELLGKAKNRRARNGNSN